VELRERLTVSMKALVESIEADSASSAEVARLVWV
jgi:hypothetical protein